MQGLVQADGDFDLVADIIEGLEKLPADYVPKPPEELCYPFLALIAVQRSEAEPNNCHFISFGVSDHLEIRDKRHWFESRGYPVALWTPPLPPEEAERYMAALSGHTKAKQWESILTEGNEDFRRNWGWIN